VARAARLLLVRPSPTLYTAARWRHGALSTFVRRCRRQSGPTHQTTDRQHEMVWVRVAATLVGALCTPLRPQYSADSLLVYVESCVAEPSPDVNRRACRRACSETVARGDFNHAAACRTETSRTERTDLTQPVRQPTRGNNVLSTASYELSSLLLSLITRPCCCVLSKSQYRVSSLLPK